MCSVRDSEMAVLDGVKAKQRDTAPFKGMAEEEHKRDYYLIWVTLSGPSLTRFRTCSPQSLAFISIGFQCLSLLLWHSVICQVKGQWDDIIFRDPLNALAGIENYKSMLWGLRFHGRIFFRALWVDIVSVWQLVEKKTIMVRWIVHGIPRVP
ncbi:hypothetical protein SASPL_106030 [Salvia splendens]|uniref:Uncharacterized protein n=1 Tax=Salvia splendens TaxID=180675 RepID=A0A8X9AC49_SALSN|nr:hypothetical protein SASPL_106030 [Salvia splendens]